MRKNPKRKVLVIGSGPIKIGEAAEFDDRLKHRVPRLALASLIMGACLWGLAQILAPQLAMPGIRYAALAALVAGGALAYAVASVLTGAIRLVDVRSSMGR